MTGNETIEYLTDADTDAMSELERGLALVELGIEYGYVLDPCEALTLATMETVSWMVGADLPVEYDGEFFAEFTTLGNDALLYLNARGIVPSAYDHGERDRFAGYGEVTAREDAARRGYGDGAGGMGAEGARRYDGAGVATI